MKCMACGFTCSMDEMLLLHQAQCDKLPAEKREFRMSVARLMFGEHLDEALALAKEMAA